MSLLGIIIAAGQSETATPLFPPFVYAVIAAIVFIFLAVVVWSFRDAANRHSHKTSTSAGHRPDHH